MFNMLKKIGMELNLNKVSREHYNFLGRVFVTDDRLIVAMNEPPKPNIYSDLDKLLPLFIVLSPSTLSPSFTRKCFGLNLNDYSYFLYAY